MSVTGVGSCVRGEVTRLFLSKGVCRGLYQLQQLIGRKPFLLCAHLCQQSCSHPAPWISLALMLTAGSKTMWENGEVTIVSKHVFREVSVAHLLL